MSDILSRLAPPPGARHSVKRKGRGTGSGLGKTAGKDSKQGKPTYVSVLGLPQARELAQDLQQDAHAALEGLGDRGQRLRGHERDPHLPARPGHAARQRDHQPRRADRGPGADGRRARRLNVHQTCGGFP